MADTPPIQMSDDAIIEEIHGLREAIDGASKRILDLCRVLHARASRARLDRSNVVAPSLVAYANAWGRLGGLVGQAVRRTTSVDRALTAAKEDSVRRAARAKREKAAALLAVEDEQALEAIKLARQKRIQVPGEVQDPTDDLLELYGREVILNAGAR